MQESESTADLVRQMREALCIAHEILFGSRPHSQSDWDMLHAASRQSIVAADQWLAKQPTNQCGETCERAKLCATCARELSLPLPQPLTDEQILDCVRSVGVPAPMGLTRDRGPYEITEPSWFLTQLVRAIERTHSIS